MHLKVRSCSRLGENNQPSENELNSSFKLLLPLYRSIFTRSIQMLPVETWPLLRPASGSDVRSLSVFCGKQDEPDCRYCEIVAGLRDGRNGHIEIANLDSVGA